MNFFFCRVFACFWYESNAGLVKLVWKHSFIFNSNCSFCCKSSYWLTQHASPPRVEIWPPTAPPALSELSPNDFQSHVLEKLMFLAYPRAGCFYLPPSIPHILPHLWVGMGEEFGFQKRRFCPLYPSQHGLFVDSCERSVLLVVRSFSEFTGLHVVAALVYMGGRLSQWPPLLPSSLSILSSLLTNFLLEFSIEKNWTFIAH